LSYIVTFVRFWYDFVVGDDWIVAAGVVAALILTARFAAWWLLPAGVVMILFASLRRAIRRSAS